MDAFLYSGAERVGFVVPTRYLTQGQRSRASQPCLDYGSCLFDLTEGFCELTEGKPSVSSQKPTVNSQKPTVRSEKAFVSSLL